MSVNPFPLRLFSRSTRRGSVKTGCLIAAVIVLLILLGVGIWVYSSWRGWAASGMRSGAVQVVNQSQLPADQKQRVIDKISEVSRDFEDKKIDAAQMGRIVEELASSPLLPLAVVYGLEESHIKKSSIPAEEKAEGRLAMERAARGIVEKSISQQAIRDILAPVTIQNPNNQIQMKQVVTDEELRQLFKNAKTRADEAKVPNEPYKVNVADEISRAIDNAMGRPTTPPVQAPRLPTPPVTNPADPAPNAPSDPTAPPPATPDGKR